MASIEYRRRLALRIGVILALFGLAALLMVGLTNCTSPQSAEVDHTIQTEIPKLTDDH